MGRETTGRLKARCPECLAAIWLRETTERWDPVTCPECHTALEVINLHPLELDYLDEWDGIEDSYVDDIEEEWD